MHVRHRDCVKLIDIAIDPAAIVGKEIECRQRGFFIRGKEVVVRDRCVVDTGDVDGDRRRVGAAVAVGNRVLETVLPRLTRRQRFERRVRIIVERAVTVQGKQRTREQQDLVADVACDTVHFADCQGVLVGIRVIGQYVAADRCLLVRRNGVVHRVRRIRIAVDGNRRGRGIGSAVAVDQSVGKTVGRRFTAVQGLELSVGVIAERARPVQGQQRPRRQSNLLADVGTASVHLADKRHIDGVGVTVRAIAVVVRHVAGQDVVFADNKVVVDCDRCIVHTGNIDQQCTGVSATVAIRHSIGDRIGGGLSDAQRIEGSTWIIGEHTVRPKRDRPAAGCAGRHTNRKGRATHFGHHECVRRIGVRIVGEHVAGCRIVLVRGCVVGQGDRGVVHAGDRQSHRCRVAAAIAVFDRIAKRLDRRFSNGQRLIAVVGIKAELTIALQGHKAPARQSHRNADIGTAAVDLCDRQSVAICVRIRAVAIVGQHIAIDCYILVGSYSIILRDRSGIRAVYGNSDCGGIGTPQSIRQRIVKTVHTPAVERVVGIIIERPVRVQCQQGPGSQSDLVAQIAGVAIHLGNVQRSAVVDIGVRAIAVVTQDIA